MTTAYVFLSLGTLALLLFSYLLDLSIFCLHREKEFSSHGYDRDFLLRLEREHKNKIHPQKKNYLLHLIIKTLRRQNETVKAEQLSVFLKSDFLLGIKKRSDR